jgi:hypothetical protein
MFDLNKDDMLSKIHPYKLDRPDGWCNIAVHEIVESEKAKIEFKAKRLKSNSLPCQT